MDQFDTTVALPHLTDVSVQLDTPGQISSLAVDCTSSYLMLAGYVNIAIRLFKHGYLDIISVDMYTSMCCLSKLRLTLQSTWFVYVRP